MKTLRRTVTAAVLVPAAAAAGLVVAAPPAQANENTLWFGQIGETQATYGPNQAVRIWGDLRFKNYGCPEGGVPDFVYPTSDVYIVPAGGGEGELVDVTGGAPNTVVQYASVFDDEVIGITSPAGTLAAGEYDVVFDTCQDGVFQPEDDSVFSGVLTVELPAELPAADAALTALKQASYEEYESWRTTQRVVNGVWKLVEKALKNGCKAGNPTACALKYGNYFNPIQEQFNGLLLNQGQHYLGIYEDPPNPDFDQPVVPEAVPAPTDPIAGEGALVQALLRSVEAYKGAQQAGDAGWALMHAREVRDLHRALAGQLAATSAQLEELRTRFSDEADEALVFATDLAGRVARQGLTPDERRTLRETGLTSSDVTDVENEIRSAAGTQYRAATVVDVLTAQSAAHDATTVAVQQGLASWSAIVDVLAGDPAVPSTHPVAHAGGPYSVAEGAAASLDGTASGPGQYAWDLDGDRDFDDATGVSPEVVFDTPGVPVIGLRVTDGAGRAAYAFTNVTVAAAGADPQIAASAPQGTLVEVQTAADHDFSVTATDAEGAPAVSWTVDGKTAGTGASLSWTAPAAPGTHEVVATATDADGHATTRAWDVLVLRPDADGDGWTATTDCEEGDAAVHPGQIEFLGNGVDDDCDPSSPDAPTGGLTGKPYGWGSNSQGQVGTGALGTAHNAPQESVLPDTVTQVELGFRVGFAVLADGTALSWGGNPSGALGDGTSVSQRPTPAPVVGPEGTGTLAGVTRISAQGGHVAAVVGTDGKVATWGSNVNGQLGDGSTVFTRNVPGFVLTGPDTPLTGVRDIEAGEGSFFALMGDGTVMGWGAVKCLGEPWVSKPYATPVPGLSDVRQIAGAGTTWFFLKKDGTVLSCGDTDAVLGRPWQLNTPTSPYLPSPVTDLGRGSTVIDISTGRDSAVALKEDGSVLVWGQNSNDELDVIGLPDGYQTRVPTPVPLPAGAPMVAVEHSDSQNTLAIRADGSMLAWGGNLDGAAGVGQDGAVSVPTEVDLPGRVFLQASTSPWNSMALTRPVDDPELELPATWVNATVEDAALSEAAGGAFTVRLDQALADDVALTWSLKAGSAGADDVDLVSGTVVVPAGQTSAPIPVEVVDDVLDEHDETVTLALTGARLGLKIARAQAIGTITDDDAAPSVSVESTSVGEGGTSLTDTPVTFRLSAPSGKEVVAAYATADGSASAGEDYVASAATIRFAPGETEDVVHLAVSGDSSVEADETFSVMVGAVTNGTAGASGTVTVADDEVLTVSVTAPTVVEGSTGEFVVSVNPTPLPGATVSVPWTVVEPASGEGDDPGDVAASSGTLQLTAEQPTGVVTVTATDDSLVEGPEPFRLELGALSASSGHEVQRGESGPGWVTDNDEPNAPPVVHAGDGVSTTEGSAVSLAGTVTDDAPGVTASWTVDGPCTVTGDGAQATVTCTDDGAFVATLTATDAEGAVASDSTTLTVANAAPVLGAVAVDGSGALIEFTDAGVDDQHSCTVEWGDGTTAVLDGALSPCFLPHAYAPGTYTATVVVTDGDGGSASTTQTVTVESTTWPFRGFLPPVENAPAVNVVKAGQSVPIKFGLDGYRGMDVLGQGSPASGQVACGGGDPNAVEGTETAGASSLSYDAEADHYTYVWQTDSAWSGQCRRLVVTLADGTQHWAEFRFR